MKCNTHLLYFTKLSGKSLDFNLLDGTHLNHVYMYNTKNVPKLSITGLCEGWKSTGHQYCGKSSHVMASSCTWCYSQWWDWWSQLQLASSVSPLWLLALLWGAISWLYIGDYNADCWLNLELSRETHSPWARAYRYHLGGQNLVIFFMYTYAQCII